MSHAKYIGRLGALAVALGVGVARATTPGGVGRDGEGSSTMRRRSDRLDHGRDQRSDARRLPGRAVQNQFVVPTHPGKEHLSPSR